MTLTLQKTDRDDNNTNCEVEVLLRPSDIEFDASSSIQATIVNKAFRGAEVLYTVRLNSDLTLLLLAASSIWHKIGDRIGIQVRSDRSKTITAYGQQ